VQGELPNNCGGFDVEYDGTHVGQSAQVVPEMLVTLHPNCSILKRLAHVTAFAALIEQQGSATQSTQQKPGKRSILATIPERYCHVGIHTAGTHTPHGTHNFMCRCIRSQEHSMMLLCTLRNAITDVMQVPYLYETASESM